MSEWWVGRQGSNPVGPVTTETLIRGIKEKKVPEDALVCRVGEQEWQRVAQVDDLWEQIHPEQFLTSVTKQPWFDEKVESGPPASPLPEAIDAEDDATRIYSVPILPMRTIEAGASTPEKQSAGAAAVTPAVPHSKPTHSRPQPPTSPEIPILSSADLIPVSANATNANIAPHAQATNTAGPSLTQGQASEPRAVIPPPRFGIDRVGTAAHVAVGPTLPSAPQAPAAVPVRPPIPAAQQPSPPQLPLVHAEVLPVPHHVGLPTAPAGLAPGQPALAMPPLQAVPQPAPAQHVLAKAPPVPHPVGLPTASVPLAPGQPAPAMPPLQAVLQPTLAQHVLAKAPAMAEEDVTVIKHTVAAVPVPPTLELEPADLFDEDYEAPPAKPPFKGSLDDRPAVKRESISPRPAAGTPPPPSVIVSHPPSNSHGDMLAHDISQTPEETRPVVRSLLPAGMIQVSIGTLIIGALGLVVLVLLGVLLAR